MVLESIINPIQAEKKPIHMLFLGAFFATLAVFISLWIFPVDPSIVLIAIIVMICAPLMYSTIKLEEKKDLEYKEEQKIMKQHMKVIHFYLYLFIGITLALVFWYLILPADSSASLFSVQLSEIEVINGNIAGRVTGHASSSLNNFSLILFNNIKVLSFCILFSFLFGLGAIFILVWNASVLAAALGQFIEKTVGSLVNMGSFAAYSSTTLCSLIKYFIHGIPEVIGYLFAGIAGGIISFAIINKDFQSKSFQKIILDVADMILLALLFLFIGALLEVYVSPLLTRGICSGFLG